MEGLLEQVVENKVVEENGMHFSFPRHVFYMFCVFQEKQKP
jgi:hypothetical protein